MKNTKLEALPPLKRFRLLQQQHELDENKENVPPISLQLPAKKRKESRDAAVLADFTANAFPSTYFLPAKKRIWALHPGFAPGAPLLPFDLNVEYAPSVDGKVVENVDNNKNPFEDKEENNQTPIFDEIPRFEETTNQESGKNEHKDVESGDEEDDGILCAICQSTDGDPTDPIVFCDGCELMVHVSCYGNPLTKGVPDGDWFCAQCLASQSDNNQNNSFGCCLCPSKGGALKPTKDGSWAHVVCAVFVPEVFFEDPDGREGIDCSRVPKRRWEDKCYLCKKRKGCVIKCSEPKCPLAFHITCGLNEDLCIEYNEGKKKKETIVAGFCKIHTELWKKQQGTGKFKIVAIGDQK